ncbi:MAG: arginine decarboxylase [Ignavibacteria bacterium]|nr:arginine decarboxylase [Ignavibacteria bacterium]
MKKQNTIPGNFFITKGSGCDEYEIHAGAMHMAMWDAGIADYNLMTYTSVLPPTSELVKLDDIELPPPGSELKTISAIATGRYSEFISAGLVFAWLYTNDSMEEKYMGLVCEVAGHYRLEDLEQKLRDVVQNLYEKTYKTKGYVLGEPEIFMEGLKITDTYGCAMVCLCFVDFD